MSIEFRCSNCSQKLGVPDDAAGRNAKCPACGTVLPVPSPAPPKAEPPAGDEAPSSLPPKQPANPFADAPSAAPAQEDYNPYASPYASTPLPTGKGAGGPLKHTKFSFEVIGYAWSLMQAQFGTCLLFGLIIIGISLGSAIVSAPLGMIQQLGGMEAIIASQVAQQIWGTLVQAFATCITVQFALLVLRGNREPLGAMFNATSAYPRILGMHLIYLAALVFGGLICASPLLLLAMQLVSRDAAFVAVFVLSIPVAVIAINVVFMLWLSSFFIVDRQASVFESFRLSAQFMSGNKLMTFLVMLITIVVSLVVIVCTCAIGSLAIIPYMALLQGVIYFAATGQLAPPAERLAAAAGPAVSPYPPTQ